MFQHIMIPVDMAEAASGTQALAVRVAADVARLYGIGVTMVSVAGGLQGKVSNSARLYRVKLEAYAAEVAAREGIAVSARLIESPDPSVDVDRRLLSVIDDLGADLVVMATHRPGWVEYLVNSHGGRLASHAAVSVLLVR
jgi:nucleotide-binding universal stress UspA family protein